MYAKGVQTLGCDSFRDPHNVDAINAFPYYFSFSQTDLDEKVAQISHLQQQLVGQVIDSHFSIYLFTG